MPVNLLILYVSFIAQLKQLKEMAFEIESIVSETDDTSFRQDSTRATDIAEHLEEVFDALGFNLDDSLQLTSPVKIFHNGQSTDLKTTFIHSDN